jgi:hypothetical protein
MTTIFKPIAPECDADIAVTSFRFRGKNYTISTISLVPLIDIQKVLDAKYGYSGNLGAFETMLFINGESDHIFPFGDLPGHHGLGVFARWDTEDAARDGHQEFVTRVQKCLRDAAM